MKSETTNISILDDHQGIIDGYLYRLKDTPYLHVSGIAHYGEELDAMLAAHPTDVLILDISVPLSRANSTSFPIMQVIPKLKRSYPRMQILVISMHTEIVLVEKLIELGVSGYIIKSDYDSITRLGQIIREIKAGENYFSACMLKQLASLHKTRAKASLLSTRQMEALSMCITYPEDSSEQQAVRMAVSPSTFRNLLSKAYKRMGVHNLSAAIAYMQKSGLIGPGESSEQS